MAGGHGVLREALFTFAWYLCLSRWTVLADVMVYDQGDTLVDEYNDLPARFGPQFPLDGLRAYPVMASDVYGCGHMNGPPATSDQDAKFVVLMARNNCTFFEKVMNAEKAGFAAAIVYNIDSDDLVEMSGDSGSTEDAHIPSMFIGYYSAMEINRTYVYSPSMKDFQVVLNRNLPFNINTHLLWPFVAVVVLTFVSMLVVTIVKCLRHRNRVARERLPHRELRKLQVIKYNQATCRYETCSICLDDYEEGERLRVLPCQHTYHTKCVDPWLTKGKRNCPMCKRKIRLGPRRTRRTSSESDSSSGTSAADTTPLLNGGRGNSTMGTFAEGGAQQQQQVEEERRSFRQWLRSLFSSSSDSDQSVPVVNERENTLPATVSAVVDMDVPRISNPPPAVFQAPSLPPSSQVEPPSNVLITTPISSPLRNVAVAHARESGSSTGGTPRIGVAALPNVDFQGGLGLFVPMYQPVQQPVQQLPAPPPPQQQQEPRNPRSHSRHNRRRRRGGHHEEV